METSTSTSMEVKTQTIYSVGDRERGITNITTKTLDAPRDVARFPIGRGSMAFRRVGRASAEHDGTNRLIVLLSFEGGTNAVYYTGIVMEEEMERVVGDGVSVVTRTEGLGNVASSSHTMASMAGVKTTRHLVEGGK